jgi:ribosomal protein L11 methyltransferase
MLRGRRFDLVFANILARPLCAMAEELAAHLAPGGTAILAGLLGTQARMVLAAHRRQGLVLERRLDVGPWTTLVLRRTLPNCWTFGVAAHPRCCWVALEGSDGRLT